MRLEALIAVLLIFGDFTVAAHADLQGLPRFSGNESQTIARNELLSAIVATDPWLVRRLLDALSSRAQSPNGGFVAPGQGIDPARDPDLSISPRDVLGTVEWNELIKRAKAVKDAREKQTPVISGRSSEGTVELIDLMRRARAKKDASGAP
jgi:hypothetical protein